MWIWLTNLALLFGAEVDAEIERYRQLPSGHRGGGVDPTAAQGHTPFREGGVQVGGADRAGRGLLANRPVPALPGPRRRTTDLATSSGRLTGGVPMTQLAEHGGADHRRLCRGFTFAAILLRLRVGVHRRDRAAPDPAVASHADRLWLALVVSDVTVRRLEDNTVRTVCPSSARGCSSRWGIWLSGVCWSLGTE